MNSIVRRRSPLLLILYFTMVNVTVGEEAAKEAVWGNFWYSHSIDIIQNGTRSGIVEVKGSKPKIPNKMGGKDTVISGSFDIVRTGAFHDGFVQITHSKIISYFAETVTDEGTRLNQMGDGFRGTSVEVECTADRDIEDCYVALILVDRWPEKNQPRYGVCFKAFGTLKAGTMKRKDVDVNLGFGRIIGAIIPTVYSQGREIRSNYSPKVADFVHGLKKSSHRGKIQRFVQDNKGKDLPAKCIFTEMPHMNFLSGASTELPEQLAVEFSLDEYGSVESTRINAPLTHAIAQTLGAVFREWEFLPKIENGRAVPAYVTVIVPLRSMIARLENTR